MGQIALGKIREFAKRVELLIEQDKQAEVEAVLASVEIHQLARLLNLSRSRVKVFSSLSTEAQAEVLMQVTPRIRRGLVATLSAAEVRAVCHFLDDQDTQEIVAGLTEEFKSELVQERIHDRTGGLQELLSIKPETAAALMRNNFLTVSQDFTVADVGGKIGTFLSSHNETPVIIVTDSASRILGRLVMADLVSADSQTMIGELIVPAVVVAQHLDQEELVRIIRDRKSSHDDFLIAADEDQHPMGVVHMHDLLAVMEEEATEDLYKFAGVAAEEQAVESVSAAVTMRYGWLILNLATAFLAAGVVALFQESLSKMVILAAYMPVIAGMGGNAGTQTLAVVVRGLALGEIAPDEGRKVLVKEVIAGIANGLIIGALVSIVAILWNGDARLGLVLAVSMIINLFAAGLFGTLIPMALRRIGVDPAVSSSVFLTTVTDVVGFFTFLGLATLFLF